MIAKEHVGKAAIFSDQMDKLGGIQESVKCCTCDQRLPVTYETSLQSTFDQKFRLPQKTTFFILHMFGACLCHDPQIFLIEQSQDVGFESLRSKLVSNRHSISIGFKATLTKSSLKLYHHIPIIDG
jgi:hypothetical protein